MPSFKKIFFVSIFTTMTMTTAAASRWQYTRYRDSMRRWNNFNKDFENFDPQELKLSDLPFSKENVLDWENRLIKLTGKLDTRPEYISRFRESRFGYNVIGILKDDQENGFIINLGWIPQEPEWQEKVLRDLSNQQTQQIIGIIRKPEVQDYLNKTYNKEDLGGYNSYINLKELVTKAQIRNQATAQVCFLEKIEKFSDQSNLSETLDYPVVDTERTIEKPYLTPQKHIEYSTFWGSCTFIGLFTIKYLLHKKF